MLCFKCDRCGKIDLESREPFAVVNIILDYHEDDSGYYELCEQCYTTIMEVLQDGEIK